MRDTILNRTLERRRSWGVILACCLGSTAASASRLTLPGNATPADGDLFGIAVAAPGADGLVIGAPQGEDFATAVLGPCIADITGAEVTFGANEGPQDPAKLVADDADRTIARSRPFFSALEPNLTILRVDGNFSCLGPGTPLVITIQDHASQPGVVNRVGLVPGGGGGLGIQVASYGVSFNVDADHEITIEDGSNFINADTGDIKMDMRYSTLALLSPLGMEARTDLVVFSAN